MKFINSIDCISRRHCIICRRKELGKAWRADMLVRYDDENVNWACPLGLPWLSREPTSEEFEVFKRVERPVILYAFQDIDLAVLLSCINRYIDCLSSGSRLKELLQQLPDKTCTCANPRRYDALFDAMTHAEPGEIELARKLLSS